MKKKIFQTHTQGPICVEEIPEDHTIYVDFPLDWDGVDLGLCKKTCYDFKLWIEVVEGNYATDYDWPNVVDIPICVGDFYDCGILDVDVETSFGGEPVFPLGIVEQGEDLHVTTWVHLQGTVPAYDVPVKFSAFKKEWTEAYFTDFEGSFPWSTGHFGDYASLWHQTDFDSWSGSKSMAYFDKDTKHYKNDAYVDYAIAPPVFDVSDYLELELRYYVKYITEGAGDYWAVMLSDEATNYVLGNIGGVGFPTNGYQPTWIGPNQPQGKYVDFDLMAAYDYWFNIRGMFRNGDGSQAYELGFGYAMWGTDGDTYTNAQAEADEIYWSGMMFDDVGVYGLEIGEEVYSDVIIVPEMIPCETYEVQFEWEDLPYSNYLLRVECEPEGGCGNWPEKVPWEAQILVVGNKERMHPKEVESIDLTGWGEGEWVISSSDYDNYIATQNGVRYGANMDQVLVLCPDHGGECSSEEGEACCIDISHLDYKWTPAIPAIPPIYTPHSFLDEDFSGGVIPAGWAEEEAGEFFSYGGNLAGGTAPEADVNSVQMAGLDTTGKAHMETFTIDTTIANESLTIEWKDRLQINAGSVEARVWVHDGTSWNLLLAQSATAAATTHTYDISAYNNANLMVRFALVNYNVGDNFYWVIDDVKIYGVEGTAYVPMVPAVPPVEPVWMDFDLWWDLEGYPWDYCDIEMAFTCPADLITDWYFIDSLDLYAYSSYEIEPDDGWVKYSTLAGGPLDIGNLCDIFGSDQFVLRFRFVSDSGFNFRGVKLDNIEITNLLQTGFPPELEDFLDTGDDLSNWCTYNMHTGQYWFHKSDRTGAPEDEGTYCNFYDVNMDGEYSGESYVDDLNDALIWTTEIADCYQAFLALEVSYNLEEDWDYGYIEIDDGSDTWWILDVFTGNSAGWITKQYDISFLAGSPIQIRFRLDSDGSVHVADGHYCIRNAHITGKQDHTAPMSSITMTGTMKDSGWYNTAVKVKITATDNVAMGEIHYILDGSENVVAGTSAEFTVSGNGQHTLEFWAVDAMGNEEAHHIVPPFRIDSGSAPTVAITAPEPGLYLFGNKILSASKVIIIGAFTIEATASDAESGIYKVQFFLDGDVIAEDTELPFSAYCAVKHMGEGTIKVVAEDFAQNTAEDTLDITYYKFL
jgi:hypothetical protein